MKPTNAKLFCLIGAIALCSTASCTQSQPAKSAGSEAVDFLVQLTRINTSNPPGNETQAAQYIKSVLDKEGIPSEIFESAPGRGNIVARLKGSGKARPLLLMAHLDVVGVEREKWSVDPFAGVIKDGYVYGRGASDDKGMVAANLAAFLQLHREKVPLDRDIIFLAEAGEEGTPKYGIEYMIENHWDKIDCEYVLNEGGSIHIKDGAVNYVSIATTEKVPRGMIVTARGSSGHGSIPRPDNPVVHISEAVAKLGNWQTPMRLNDTTRVYFQKLAQIADPELKSLLENLNAPETQTALRQKYWMEYSKLRTSIVPTIIKGGFRTNVIPGDAEATLDVRALPDENIPALMEQMKKLVNDPAIEIKRTSGNDRPASPPSRIDTDLYRAMEATAKKMFPNAITMPDMLTGATDSSQLRAKGVQAYGISTPKTDDDAHRVHGNDERTSVDGLNTFTRYLHDVVIAVAGLNRYS
jgi:acetylornithine deacetylase/succinyl-diaminopimelate desuccinylase-like protein